MNGFELIRMEWNDINGFIFTILGIEYGKFEGELLGIHFGSGNFLVIYALYFRFEISHPFY